MFQKYHIYSKYFLIKTTPFIGEVHNFWIGSITDTKENEDSNAS